MEKTIKYLENGEYHYATVKDVGDLAKLKTDSKDDLVTAINELFITGGEASKKPDGYDELVDNVADAIQKQQQMTDTITNMQQSAQLSDAEMQHMKQVQEEAHQEYLKAIKELNEAVDKAKADAADLDKKTSDLQDKLDETFASVDKEVSDVHKQLDSESAGLRKDLDDTKTSLESTRKDLLNNTQEFGVVNSEVKELKDKMDRRIWSTDLDPVREQVNKNTTEVSQTKDELKSKADQSNLDLVTNSVENLSTQVKENADGLKVSVKKDELGGDVAKLLNDKTNLLLGTRNFSGSNWLNKEYWHEEPGYWNGLKVYSSEQQYYGIQYQYYVKAGNTYTFSLWAKQDVENLQAAFYLLAENKEGIVDPLKQENVIVKTEWTRVHITFDALQDAFIYPRLEQTVVKNKLYVAGYKLELGKNATPWEPNEADIAENIEHTESQFNVYSDQIAGIVKKQEKMGDTERQLDTRITETAEGLKQTSKNLEDANGKITEFKGQLESTAKGLKTEYEKYTNDAIGQISDSSLNLIHNSAFSNQDNQFESWQNISAKATVREDSNNLHWVELTQSGQGTDNPIGVTSNYFIIKQGKVTVAVDVKLGDKANLDNQNILLLELYDESKKRVDFTDVSVSQLGLSMSVLNDHNVHRGLYRLGIDRKDVKYMTVKAILHRNGDLWFTNFSARLSSIDDGGYTPNPDDVNHQILKMNTKIEEDAEHIALKANSVDVTRDIKDAVQNSNGGGVNLVCGTAKFDFPIWSNGGTQSIQKYDNETNFIQHTAASPSFIGPWFGTFIPEIGKTYTISADVAGNGYILGDWFRYEGNDSSTLSRVNLTDNWQRISNTIHVDRISGNWVIYANASTMLKIKHIKIEQGSVATPWTPAVEDTSAEIKSAKDAAIQVASDQINLHVNELSTQFDDKLNKRVNEVKTASEKFTSDGIEQTVKKITEVKNDVNNVNSKLDNLRVGGRNLFALSRGRHGVINPAGNFIAGENDFSIANIPLSGSKKLIFSAYDTKFKATDDSRIVVYNAQGNVLGQVSPFEAGEVIDLSAYPTADHIGLSLAVCYQGNNSVGNTNISQWLKDNRYKLEIGTLPTDWSPAPEDINQSIKDATEYKTVTGTIDFNNLKTQQKIFYKDLQATNAPAGGNYWYYLDVEPGYDGRILQTAISDRDNITWVRTFVDNWGPWIRQADQRNVDDLNNQIDSLKTETTASVKNLGDRVTTEVNSITTRQDNFENETKAQHSNDVELVRKSDFEDGSKGGWTAQCIVSATNPAPPSELGQSGMKVLQTNVRDAYEEGIWYSVKPGEKFDVDYWCASSPAFHTTFGLVFVDKDKAIWNWLGINSDQSGQWKHYTGTITAPANAAFAKPWYQMEKPADNTSNTSWIAKPHVRRQNPQVAEKISELNTKWDVANGQIQGKVTATDVNNILNGKGYATQSWAESNFRMKSDSISLEVKEITDPISNRVNSVNSKLDNLRVGGTNLLKNSVGPFQPHTDRPIDNYDEYPDSVVELVNGEQYTISAQTNGVFSQEHNPSQESDKCVLWLVDDAGINQIVSDENTAKGTTFTWNHPTKKYVLRVNTYHPGSTNQIKAWKIKIEKGNKATDWSPAPEDTSAEIKSAKDDAINVANDKVNNSHKELQGQIDTSHKELQDKIDDSNKELQDIKAITQWHTVSGPIDLNDLKTQTRIFYQDIQDKNSAVTGWQYIVVDSSSDKVTQTVWKDNSTIQYIRQFTGAWSNWVRQTNQNDIDEAKTGLREEIKSAKEAAIQVASDQINLHVNELSTSFDDKLNKRVNEVKTASEKFTSDGIKQVVTKVTEVKNDVDRLGDTVNSFGGGVNLLLNSKDLHTGWSQDGTSVYKIDGYLSIKAIDGLRRIIENPTEDTNGKILSVSFDAMVPDDSKNKDVVIYAGPLQAAMGVTISGNTFKRYKVENWKWNSVNKAFSIQFKNVGDKINLRNIKLEYGSVSTPWSPAPEDINQSIKDATEYKTVTGTIDFNNLKTQQKIFYKDTQATNAPAGGNYWYYLDVEPGYDGRILQTAISDRDNITWVRTFADSWSPWIKQADQRNVDDLNNQINGFKTEVTASVKNLGDRVTTEVNSVETRVNNKIGEISVGGRNYISPKNINKYYADNLNYDNNSGIWTVNIPNGCGGSWGAGISFGQSSMVVPWGQAYTDSVEVYVTEPNLRWQVDINNYGIQNDSNLGGNDNDDRGRSSSIPQAGSVIPTNQWYKLSFTAWNTNGKNENHIGLWDGSGFGIVNNTGHTITVKFRRPKQELGTKATDWSTNPDDTIEAIKEVNTKWDVANGQIQGKVTETQVNNILNGKGYATQSWAETMFTMKKDSITLQAVRDNITNGIQNQVNGINNKIDTQTLDSADINNMRTQGHYFVRNLANSPIYGWVYVDVTGNGNDRIKQDVYQDSGYEHRSRRWYGSYWTEWTTDVNNKNVVSQINITPDNIKIASKKITIDGDTDIQGDLRTDRVRLVGKQGLIDMTGDQGIQLKNSDGSSILLGNGNMDLMYKSDFRMNIDSSMITIMHRNPNMNQSSPIAIGNIGAMFRGGNGKCRGLGIRYNPGSDNEQLHGADFLDIGYNDPNKLGNIINQLEFTSKDMQLGETRKRKGINFLDDINLQSYQKINVGDNDQEPDGKWTNDPLMIHRVNWKASSQTDRYQPTIRLGWNSKTLGTAGVTFLWDQLKPFGNRDISDLGEIWFNGMKFAFGYVHHNRMFGGADQPAFMRIDPGNGSIMSGIAFTPGSTWDLGSGAWNITGAMMNSRGA